MAAFAERRRIISMDHPDFDAGAALDERSAAEGEAVDSVALRAEDEFDAAPEAGCPAGATVVEFAVAPAEARAQPESEPEDAAEVDSEEGEAEAVPGGAAADDGAADDTEAAASHASAAEADAPAGDSAGAAEADGEAGAAPQGAARPEELRLLEAMLFASSEPLDEKTLAARLPDGVEVRRALGALQLDYAARGINLVKVGGKWTFRTANDLAWLLSRESVEPRKLSRAALETLAIIAYHQPVTRAEIEEIRGVSTSKGTVDVLLQIGWIRPRGRRKAPGRPVTYGTTEQFLSQFSLEALSDLPGLEELKGSGLLDGRLPPGFAVPMPSDDPALREDEDPLEPGDLDLTLAPPVERTED